MYLKFFNIAYWFVPYIQMTCLGLFFLKLFRFPLASIRTVIRAFWLGVAGLIVCLQISHFFWPVSGGVITFIFVLSLAGLLLSCRELSGLINKFTKQDWAFICLSLLIISTWIYAWRMVRPFRYDTGLYYIQRVHWLVGYPVVLGLGNFYERLAFPHTYFLYAAFLESAYWKMGGFYVSSYLLIVGVFLEWLMGVRHVVFKRIFRLADLYRILLIFPVVLYRCTDYLIVTASPDTMVFLLMLVTTAWFLDHEDQLPSGNFHLNTDMFILVTVLLVGLTVKTDFVLFGATLIAILFLKAGLKNNGYFWGGIALLMMVPYFIHNVLESGFLYYPLPAPCFPVLWRMPVDIQQKLFVDLAHHWNVAGWVKFCFKWDRAFLLFPMPLVIFGLVFGWRNIFKIKTLSFILPSALTFMVMFLTASPTRYFGASLWVPAMLFTAMALEAHARWLSLMTFRWLAFIFLLMFLISLARTKFITLEPVWAFEKPRYQKVIIGDDIEVLQVIDDNRCWAAPLPCTPRPLEGVHLIDPRRIAAGFYRSSSYDAPKDL